MPIEVLLRCGDIPDSIINVIAFVVKPNELVMISSFVYDILTHTRSKFNRSMLIQSNRNKKKENCCRFFVVPYRGKNRRNIHREYGRNYIIRRIVHSFWALAQKKFGIWLGILELGTLEQFLYFVFRVHIDLIFDVFNFTSTTRRHRLGYTD